jgi:putative DNA primase/helicase
VIRASNDTGPARRKANAVVTIGMHLTDTGNAERLVARYRDRIRYCTPRKRWLIWDGKRWAWDERDEIVQLGKSTVLAIYGEAEHGRDEDARAAITRHAMQSEKRERRTAMIALAQSEPGIPVLPRELDSDPWSFNCANGTIDLQTGELRPHNRDDLVTKVSPVDYVPGATHALWDRYLADALHGDVELIAYLQRALGYALQGQVTEKAFWFLHGAPDGMKSTFIDSVSKTLGDYAVTTPFTTWLVQTNTGGNRGDLVRLLGARLVTSVEVRKGMRFDEEILKAVTGGDMLTYAAKYEAEIQFPPTFALWLAANDAPTIRDDDEGAWSRVRRLPFTHPLPEERRDKNMRNKLAEPDVQQAILAWAVAGCIAWQRDGLGTCAAVELSTNAYRAEMDRAAGFFEERCLFNADAKVPDPDAKALTTSLRSAYEAWCRDNNVKVPLTSKELAERLKSKGCTPSASNGQRTWKGVRLLFAEEEGEQLRAPRSDAVTASDSNLGKSSMSPTRREFTGNPSLPVTDVTDLPDNPHWGEEP